MRATLYASANASRIVTHVVTENRINCKHTDCVEVCPVDCFHEGPNFLVPASSISLRHPEVEGLASAAAYGVDDSPG